MLELNKIYLQDCFEGMKLIDDKSVDLIVTDPPFLTTDCDFDKTSIDWTILFDEYYRILKNNGWFFMFGTIEMFSEVIKNKDWKRKFEYIWIKPSIIPCTHNTMRPATQHEIICAFIKSNLKKVTNNRRVPIDRNGNKKAMTIINKGFRVGSTVIHYPNKNKLPYNERTSHPTQKPYNLIELIIKGYSAENSIVLDSFIGSGTVALACKNLNRNFIGFENNLEYFNIAQKRLNL